MVKIIDANTGEFEDLVITLASGTTVSLGSEQITVLSPEINTSSAISGQITVTASGTAVQGSDVTLTNGVFLKAMAANTGKAYVGASGVTLLNGFELSASELIIIQVANLNELWFDGSVNSTKICWLKG
jgi:hypothetical protein